MASKMDLDGNAMRTKMIEGGALEQGGMGVSRVCRIIHAGTMDSGP